MAHYIDKTALVAEIERLKDFYNRFDDNIQSVAKYNVLVNILSFIDTLEVKEADMEKELSTYLEVVKATDEDIDYVDFANHFFELGMAASNKAQKGEEV